jgi:hypothetical protein
VSAARRRAVCAAWVALLAWSCKAPASQSPVPENTPPSAAVTPPAAEPQPSAPVADKRAGEVPIEVPTTEATDKPVSARRSSRPIVVFRGMCDASGAVVLDDKRFVVADDEDNVLRVYDGELGGDPLYKIDVSSALDLPRKKKTPEADIEAATRLGDRALWLTSHGLSSKGKLQPSRFRFFATTAPSRGLRISPIGTAYQNLLRDMFTAPQLAQFNLEAAAQVAPKELGGLNIEGMTSRSDGTSVLIGFRNPVPDQKALLVPLLNPLQLVTGEAAKLGDPQLLNLGGRGVRSLTLWRGQYLIMAGSPGNEHRSLLFTWDGTALPRPITALDLSDINPEAFVSRDAQDEVMLLSDDGSVEVDGEQCKKLKDRGRKQFRGLWVRVAI